MPLHRTDTGMTIAQAARLASGAGGRRSQPQPQTRRHRSSASKMLSKLCLGLSLAAVAFADEPVGTVIGIDLGTTYSVSPPAQLLRPPTGFTAGCLLAPQLRLFCVQCFTVPVQTFLHYFTLAELVHVENSDWCLFCKETSKLTFVKSACQIKFVFWNLKTQTKKQIGQVGIAGQPAQWFRRHSIPELRRRRVLRTGLGRWLEQ